ncbi:esterase [Amylibacter marinus]|uniref:Esterase n=1 Tax=Amylibacter marinus TaxID=1475483 RepID=A0ABQ5VTN9_9RHOB|nr:alpha/beta hydrolase [Amylibacter marinus]GLQ34483.1 esterase [Amylibacter marinus]
MDWDCAYDVRAAIKDAELILSNWSARAKRFRAQLPDAQFGLDYGAHPREKYDFLPCSAAPAAAVIFIHGGYWRSLDRSVFTHLMAGFLDHDVDVFMPSYPLTPEVRIEQIVDSIGRALEAIAARTKQPIYLVGHSAGGHLAMRMICDTAPLSRDTQARIVRATSVSGLHDLRPLLKTKMNEGFRLTMAEAEQQSPALAQNLVKDVQIWVGTNEVPSFFQQSTTLNEAWDSARINTEPDADHFTILEPLADAQSRLVRSILDR